MTSNNPHFASNSAVASYIDSSGNSVIHVFVSDGYTVTEKVWSGGGWQTGYLSVPGHTVSATAYSVGGSNCLRVYCVSNEVITEYGNDGGSGNGWYTGSFSYP